LDQAVRRRVGHGLAPLRMAASAAFHPLS
jgi:hypothetical protein